MVVGMKYAGDTAISPVIELFWNWLLERFNGMWKNSARHPCASARL